MKTKPVALLSVLLLCGWNGADSAAAAIDLFDNLGAASSSTTAISTDYWVAQSFATDGNSYILSSVTLPLQFLWGTPAATMSIYDDHSGIPNAVVGLLTSPASYPTQPLENTTFTSSGIVLNPNATYWVVVNGNVFDWASTYSTIGRGPGFRTTYAAFNAPLNQWTVNKWGQNPQLMKVTAEIVPEPGAFPLAGAGLAMGIVFWRKWLKRSSSSVPDEFIGNSGL